jgi:probable phosphoglycerate mutase
MKVFLVRHGQTIANLDHSYRWSNDFSLDPLGVEQVKEAAKVLASLIERPAAIICSPRERTRQTAQLLAEKLKLEVRSDRRLVEGNVGEWSRRPINRVYGHFAELTPAKRYKFRPPGGETWQEMGVRIAEVAHGHTVSNLKSIVIVSHEAPLVCGVGTLLGLHLGKWSSNAFPNASVSLLEYTPRSGWKVAFVGRTGKVPSVHSIHFDPPRPKPPRRATRSTA